MKKADSHRRLRQPGCRRRRFRGTPWLNGFARCTPRRNHQTTGNSGPPTCWKTPQAYGTLIIVDAVSFALVKTPGSLGGYRLVRSKAPCPAKRDGLEYHMACPWAMQLELLRDPWGCFPPVVRVVGSHIGQVKVGYPFDGCRTRERFPCGGRHQEIRPRRRG